MMESEPFELDPLPDLAKISSKRALWYVIRMLEHLVRTHHELHPGSLANQELFDEDKQPPPSRHPSFSEAQREATRVSTLIKPGDSQTASPNDSPRPHILSPDMIHVHRGSPDMGEASPVLPVAQAVYHRFYLKVPPAISIADYILRFEKYCRASTSTYIAAGRYLFLVCVHHKTIPITRFNVYRLFCAAFMVASKVVEDVLYPFSRYANTGGVSPAELTRLEISFLFLVNFDILVDMDRLNDAVRQWAELLGIEGTSTGELSEGSLVED